MSCYYGFVGRRQIAYAIDFVAWWFLLAPIIKEIALETVAVVPVPQQVAAVVPAICWIAFLGKDGFSGHSFGKRICGLRVVDKITGQPIGMRASLVRNLPLLVPVMPIVLALQLRGFRIGDGWSRSKVVWEKYTEHPVFGAYEVQEQSQLKATTAMPQAAPMKLKLDRYTAALIATGMVCATVVLFGFFLWPTPYRYEVMITRGVHGDQYGRVYRINRFTGNTITVKPKTPNR